MKRTALSFAMIAVALIAGPSLAVAPPAKDDSETKQSEAKRPSDRVIVMYFHRTQRCATCQKMGAYSEEAIVKGFEKKVKEGTIEFHFVDFQDEKNVALAKGYKITGPTLLAVRIVKDKAAAVENLKEMWTKHRDKDAFLKYVRDSVVALEKKEVREQRAERKAG